MSKLDKLPDNVFRANVGAVIINTEGEVLALERKEISGAWQMPQGGLHEGEELYDAVLREIEEETGIKEDKLKLLEEYPEWLAYELEKDKRAEKHGRGQVQKWFLFLFEGTDQDIKLPSGNEGEFEDWKWISLAELANETIFFRQKIYQKLADGFSKYLKLQG